VALVEDGPRCPPLTVVDQRSGRWWSWASPGSVVGIVLSLECSRLARSNADWYRLLDLAHQPPQGAHRERGAAHAAEAKRWTAVMAEIDITSTAPTPSCSPPTPSKPPTSWSTMGCGDTCPTYPGRRYLDWNLPDPAGSTSRRRSSGISQPASGA
jgi:hypothetical protein